MCVCTEFTRIHIIVNIKYFIIDILKLWGKYYIVYSDD